MPLNAISVNSSIIVRLKWPFPAELVARQCPPAQYGLSTLCLSLAGVAVLLYRCSVRFELAIHSILDVTRRVYIFPIQHFQMLGQSAK